MKKGSSKEREKKPFLRFTFGIRYFGKKRRQQGREREEKKKEEEEEGERPHYASVVSHAAVWRIKRSVLRRSGAIFGIKMGGRRRLSGMALELLLPTYRESADVVSSVFKRFFFLFRRGLTGTRNGTTTQKHRRTATKGRWYEEPGRTDGLLLLLHSFSLSSISFPPFPPSTPPPPSSLGVGAKGRIFSFLPFPPFSDEEGDEKDPPILVLPSVAIISLSLSLSLSFFISSPPPFSVPEDMSSFRRRGGGDGGGGMPHNVRPLRPSLARTI